MAEQYPFDPSMTKATNKIVREQHVITSTNFRNFHYVIPHFAPFFAESLTLKLRLPNGQMRDMVEGRDYYLSHQFLDASATTNHMINGSISFLDTDTEGVLEINYHTLGGKWTLTPARIIEIMANNLRNPRITSWEFVADVPERFPVVDHPHDIVDFKTMADVQRAVDGVRDAVLASSGGGLSAHVNNYSNPHNVTKTQVGLGNVQNYGIATTAEAEAGTSNAKYMTPVRTAEAITKLAGNLVNNHAIRTDNPHATTKAQVGLGSVENYAIATQAEAQGGTVSNKYMTPLRTAEAIKALAGDALSFHVARTDNPHNVNKSQIGLFNVENYLIATAEEARAGDRNDRYMTPLRTTQLVQQYVFGAMNEHVIDFSNPHNVTKAQVGLGLVDNFATASAAEAQAGVANDRFMTPARTAQAIEALAIAPFNDHINNLNNPHQVTKAQVGLGNVQNYAIASVAEAQAGAVNDKYMTPYLVKTAINALSSSVDTHSNATNNPHQVTKAQVGLGSVENYGIATQAEASAGVVNNKYMTPYLVKTALGGIESDLASHAQARDNPHQVTKAQVGLGSVENYGIATLAEAQAGTSNVKYMTPYLVKNAVTAISTELGNHALATNNPHNVTKSQVGLGNVDNFPTATTAEIQAGTATNRFVTPYGVAVAIAAFAGDVSGHISDRNNPHNVTAEQVNAYTRAEVDQQLSRYQLRSQAAADSERLEGMTYAQLEQQLFASDTAVAYQEDIISDITETAARDFVGKKQITGGSSLAWYRLHRLDNGGTEKLDGVAMVTVAGVAAGTSSSFFVRTAWRSGANPGMYVEPLGPGAINSALKFGFVRSGNVVESYVQLPANSGVVRMVEFGNAAAPALALHTTSATISGMTTINPTDIWALNGSIDTRVQTLESTKDNHAQRISALETIIQSITVV